MTFGLSKVDIENFRCFKRLTVDGLTQVNLFVGRNNSGKTAFLEAVEAVVSESSPFVLYRASIERGEFRSASLRDEPDVVSIDVRRWFFGHRIDPGSQFVIRAWGDRDYRLLRRIERSSSSAQRPGHLDLKLEQNNLPPGMPSLLPFRNGFLGAGPPTIIYSSGAQLAPPVIFISTRRLLAYELLPMWSKILLTPSESAIVDALKILDPSIDRLALTEAGGQVLLKGATEPVPLGSLGEGMTRMLTLALSLEAARNGFVLIDEIETGLHYSAHRDMWRLVIGTAKRLNVQVFATTHSKDCIEAIARLYEDEPDTANEVTIHRLEAGLVTSTRMSAEIIAGNVETNVDVR
jgi:hypothetical protein